MNSYTNAVYAIQIELSTLCNSLCIGCVRTDPNLVSTKEFIPHNVSLPLDKVVALFTSKIGRQIQKVEFCGTIDEPLAYPDFFQLIEELYDVRPDLKITISTNGSLRDATFHFQLSTLLDQFHDQGIIRYSIDGIGDSHELYRHNTSYHKAITNMEAAVKGGADIVWQFVMFPWNRSQIEEAKKMAISLGVSEVDFREDRGGASEFTKEEIIAHRKKNLPPHPRPVGFFDLSNYIPRSTDSKIDCRFMDENGAMLFLAWDGRIWPCCFYANVYYAQQASQDAFEKIVLAGYDENFNSIYHHNLDEILSHSLFKNDLIEGWKNPKEKRSWRCSQKCSQKNSTCSS